MRRVWVWCVAAAVLMSLAAPSAGAGSHEEVRATPLQEKFMAALGSRAAAAEKTGAMAVRGAGGWLFFSKELRHLSVGRFWGERAAEVSRASSPEAADPLPVIVDVHEQLKGRGIKLVLVPVPPKAVVYPDEIASVVPAGEDRTPPRLDPYLQAFYEQLERRGVTVLDLVPMFLKNRDHAKGPVYCRTDTHWSGVGCVLAAEAIAATLRTQPWYASTAKKAPASEWRDVTITGDLVRHLPEGSPAAGPETLKLRFVGTQTGPALEAVAPDEASPVLLMGDSHTLVFHAGGDLHAAGAGLPDQLAAELGLAVDLIGTRGSGATPVRFTLYRRSLKDKAYLAGKKVVVWCLSAREFTESFQGWQTLPVSKWPAAKASE